MHVHSIIVRPAGARASARMLVHAHARAAYMSVPMCLCAHACAHAAEQIPEGGGGGDVGNGDKALPDVDEEAT